MVNCTDCVVVAPVENERLAMMLVPPVTVVGRSVNDAIVGTGTTMMKLVDLLLARMFAVSDTVWLALGAVVDAAPLAVKPAEAVSVVLEVAAVDPAERLVGRCRSSA